MAPRKRPSLAESMKSVGVAPRTPTETAAAIMDSAVVAEMPALTPRRRGKGKPKPVPQPEPARTWRTAATRVGKTRVTAMLTPELHREIKHIAVDTGVSIESILREALEQWIEKRSK